MSFGVQQPKLRAHEFKLIGELVVDICGIKLGSEAMLTAERKLIDRLAAVGVADFSEYYEYLRYHPARKAELERAIDALTTNETYFFRELIQLRAFEHEVLPQLREAASVRRTLTVWSAGCSTGEEVYSLAILIARSGLFTGWDVRVFGNDISKRVLQSARRGVYRDISFRAMPAEFGKYFDVTSEGRAVKPEIAALCQFGQFNLLDDSRIAMLGHVDAIFCRNVLIYFDAGARRRVIQSFYDRLQPGGYLLLGHSESLLHSSTAFELAHLHGDLAYRRPLETDAVLTFEPSAPPARSAPVPAQPAQPSQATTPERTARPRSRRPPATSSKPTSGRTRR